MQSLSFFKGMLVEYSMSFLTNTFFLFSFGMYATIGLIVQGFRIFKTMRGLQLFIALFATFFIGVYIYTSYERSVVYGLSPDPYIGSERYLGFSLISACIMTVLYYLFSIPLGPWAFPAAIIVSSLFIIKPFKDFIWPMRPPLEPLVSLYAVGLYTFYGIFAGVAYILVHYTILSLTYGYAIACFMALTFGMYYERTFVYKQPLQDNEMIIYLLVAIVLAILAAVLVKYLIDRFGFSKSIALISVAIGLKTLQTILTGLIDMQEMQSLFF